ncbi:MAG: PP2C family protein-serine/threonine phosphatase [Phycisphaerae bacterium]
MACEPKILWLGDGALPDNLHIAMRNRGQLSVWQEGVSLADQIGQAPLAVICPNGSSRDPVALSAMLDEIERTAAVGVFVLPADAEDIWKQVHDGNGTVLWIREEASVEEISAKLDAAGELQPAIRNLKSALLAHQDEDHQLEIVAEEMRLASRLQRDFLPRQLPEVGSARFNVIFHPASFVSGDIYDVVRLDETHIGFYVADAVGHGMPAALLTMYIKKALQTKRIVDNSYEIVPPAESLAELNASICEQNLSSCQFCTAIYCVLDTSDGTLSYSRAGHPEPVLLRTDGTAETLEAPGSLLGVFPEAQFSQASVKMNPGDRLIVYTDGAEAYAKGSDTDGHEELLGFLSSLGGIDRQQLNEKLEAWVQRVRDISREEDDITILSVDI